MTGAAPLGQFLPSSSPTVSRILDGLSLRHCEPASSFENE
jgi:hypothetical protein